MGGTRALSHQRPDCVSKSGVINLALLLLPRVVELDRVALLGRGPGPEWLLRRVAELRSRPPAPGVAECWMDVGRKPVRSEGEHQFEGDL